MKSSRNSDSSTSNNSTSSSNSSNNRCCIFRIPVFVRGNNNNGNKNRKFRKKKHAALLLLPAALAAYSFFRETSLVGTIFAASSSFSFSDATTAATTATASTATATTAAAAGSGGGDNANAATKSAHRRQQQQRGRILDAATVADNANTAVVLPVPDDDDDDDDSNNKPPKQRPRQRVRTRPSAADDGDDRKDANDIEQRLQEQLDQQRPRRKAKTKADRSDSESHRKQQHAGTAKANLGNDNKNNSSAPELVWLASYPNSGTSYTMTLVERASNLSTATHYGPEVTPPDRASLPIYYVGAGGGDDDDGTTATTRRRAAESKLPPSPSIGPYWEGLEGAALMKHTIRDLPQNFVLTKTHCGGRCLRCGADQYVVPYARNFLDDCLRTTYQYEDTGGKKIRLGEGRIDASRVVRMVHLFRSPFDNVVARFHLDNRHLMRKGLRYYPRNATGFREYCREEIDIPYGSYDDNKNSEEEKNDPLSKPLRDLIRKLPCGAEFYKYAQWHTQLAETVPFLGNRGDDDDNADATIPVLYLFYEDYQDRFNETVDKLMSFVDQPIVSKLRPFRSLPDYVDHFTDEQRVAARQLLEQVSSPKAWKLIQERYFP